MANRNHFVCPNCGLDFQADGAYATCDGCNQFFYANQSKNCNPHNNSVPSGPTQESTGTGIGGPVFMNPRKLING